MNIRKKRMVAKLRNLGLVLLLVLLQIKPIGSAQAGSSQGQEDRFDVFAPIYSLLLDDPKPIISTLTADAGLDTMALLGSVVQLDGSASSALDHQPVNFSWLIVSAPDDSVAVLDNPRSESPSFVLDRAGTYTIQLIVDNEIDSSEPDFVEVKNVNRLPVANAGSDQFSLLGELVEVDGSASFDLDDDELSYFWGISSAPLEGFVEFNSRTSVKPHFMPVKPGLYLIDLVVNDGLISSEIDQSEIHVLYGLTLDVRDILLGVGRSTELTVSLNTPAPQGGLVLDIEIDDLILEASSLDLSFAQGESSKTIILKGISEGQALVAVDGEFVHRSVTSLAVTTKVIDIREVDVVAPGGSMPIQLQLSQPAPSDGVTINLETTDIALASVSPASIFIEAGQTIPDIEALLTATSFGDTVIRATAEGFAADAQGVTVALTANFNEPFIAVPEFGKAQVVIDLKQPAPVDGVTFDLLLVVKDENDGVVFSTNQSVFVESGESQSPYIIIDGLADGTATLKATAVNFVPFETRIEVLDAPDVYLTGSAFLDNPYLEEVVIGNNLQSAHSLIFEQEQIEPIDILLEVPENSGLLLSRAFSHEGSTQIFIENFSGIETGEFFIQALEIGDDVPVDVTVFEADTQIRAAVEYRHTTVDVDPATVYVRGRSNFNTYSNLSTRLYGSNRTLLIDVRTLSDEPEPTLKLNGTRRYSLRAGLELDVEIQADNPEVVGLPSGATTRVLPLYDFFNHPRNEPELDIEILNVGTAKVFVPTQPEGFSDPKTGPDGLEVTVEAPSAWLGDGGIQYRRELIVGLDLQEQYAAQLQTAPPEPVDVKVSIAAGAGALLSRDNLLLGDTEILFEDVEDNLPLGFTLQGLELGDDVPIVLEVFKANTLESFGYNILPSTVDVDPSGVHIVTRDYDTTPFARAESIEVRTTLISDDETPGGSGRGIGLQKSIRAGIDLEVAMQVSDPLVAALPISEGNIVTIPGGKSSGLIDVSPLASGTAVVSIVQQPEGFSLPSNKNDEVVVSVDAPDVFITSDTSAQAPEIIVGLDLQQQARVRLETIPIAPVDIVISVPEHSGTLLSFDPLLEGSKDLKVANYQSGHLPRFWIQATALGDNVPITVEVFDAGTTDPAGYDYLPTTVDVDLAGVYFIVPSLDTTTISDDTQLRVAVGRLLDEDEGEFGPKVTPQNVRGGTTIEVPVVVDDSSVVSLPNGASATVMISASEDYGILLVEPLAVGLASISIQNQPAGFHPPVDRAQTSKISVGLPELSLRFGSDAIVGSDLQRGYAIELQPAPPTAIDLTIEVIDSLVAIVSQDRYEEGSSVIVLESVFSSYPGNVYIQGLAAGSSTQVKVSAPGYKDWLGQISVVESGVRLNSGTITKNVGDLHSPYICIAEHAQEVRGGISIDVDILSTNESVATVVSPVEIPGGVSCRKATITAIGVGVSSIQLIQPEGFSLPPANTEFDIIVNP